MISREFIYEFSKFDDIKSRAHDICRRKMGVLCEFGVIQHYKVGFGCRQNQRSCTKQPLRLREMGVWYKFEGISCQKVRRRPVREGFGAGRGTRLLHSY